MLGIQTIVRLLETGQHASLLDGCLSNGVKLPLSLRLRLASEDVLPIAALSVGLARTLEMSHRLTDDQRALAHDLLNAQHPDGRFGPRDCPAVTVKALAALSLLENHLARMIPSLLNEKLAARVQSAIEYACESLHSCRALSDDFLFGDAETSTLLLVVLARYPRLHTHLDPGDIASRLTAGGSSHDRQIRPLLMHAQELLRVSECADHGAPIAA